MGHTHEQRIRTVLGVVVAVAATAAAVTGIVSSGGPGPETHETFRGTDVTLYGRGIYRHMSADVAIQGIAQDVVTVAIAVPLLLGALWFARVRTGGPGGTGVTRGTGRSGSSPRQRTAELVLAGTLLYFLVTYTFYLAMATYNELFLVYALLMGCSFFTLILVVLGLGREVVTGADSLVAPGSPRVWGAFLIANAALIGLLWLSVVVPPLLDGSLYPDAVQHYTTLIVQGFDLGLLLPASVVIGVLLRRRAPLGRLFGPIYLVFLSLIMTALIAKLIAMALSGVPTAPAIFIIPVIAALAVTGAVRMLPR